MKSSKILYFVNLGHSGNVAGMRTVFRFMALAFLGMNLVYRVWTIFNYSCFVEGLFIFLGLSCVVVIFFPKHLKVFLFLFGLSFFFFGFRSYDIKSQVFETIVAFS